MPPAARYWADKGKGPQEDQRFFGVPRESHHHGDAPPDRALLHAADEERRARIAHHHLAWDYYEGRHPKPLKTRPGGADNSVILNLVALHAEHTIAFAVPDFPALELDDERDTQTEAALRALWKANGGAVWLSNLMLCGLLDGHVFVRILPPVLTSPLPRFVPLNPANVTVYWDDGDVERVLWYEVRYAAEGERRRQDIIAPGVIDNGNWLIRDYREISASYTPGAGRWELISESESALPPLVDWQHLPRPGAFYGRHELGNLGLIDAVNRVASDVKAILRAHASPRVVGFGFQAGTLQETAIDALWTIPDANARIEVLEMQSDLAASMRYMEFLSSMYMQLARVTTLAGGPEAYKGVTNLAIRSAYMAQLAKTALLHEQYGRGIARLSRIALALMGRQDALPDVRWKSALPESDLENVWTLAQERSLGIVSQETAAAKRGYSWELEKARMAAAGETPREAQVMGFPKNPADFFGGPG